VAAIRRLEDIGLFKQVGYDKNGALNGVLFGRVFPTSKSEPEQREQIKSDLINMCNYIAKRYALKVNPIFYSSNFCLTYFHTGIGRLKKGPTQTLKKLFMQVDPNYQ
jgi:hypothetical protein